MAARATWKGVLKISLVTIPIKVFPATDAAEGLSFNQLHTECQTRISQRRWCTTCAREVKSDEIAKGFEFEKGRYVVLSDDDFDKVKPASAKVIDLTQFAEASALDPIYVDRSYYLGPDGPRAGEAFAVMRAAMRDTVGIGKLAIYGREYLVAVRPPLGLKQVPAQAAPLLLHTLHHTAEIREGDVAVSELATVTRVPLAQVQLARKVITTFMRPRKLGLNLAAFRDQYRVDLQRVIDAKIAGEQIVEPKTVERPNVVNLRDALTKSLQAVAKTTPARVTMADRRVPRRKHA